MGRKPTREELKLEQGDSMTTVTVDPTLGIDGEAELLSRLLSAIATHSNLPDALMSFYAALPEDEAALRRSLVLTRLDEMLPADILLRLRKPNSPPHHPPPRFAM